MEGDDDEDEESEFEAEPELVEDGELDAEAAAESAVGDVEDAGGALINDDEGGAELDEAGIKRRRRPTEVGTSGALVKGSKRGRTVPLPRRDRPVVEIEYEDDEPHLETAAADPSRSSRW